MAKRFPDPTEEDIFKSRLTAMAVESDLFKREDIYTLFVVTRIINFFKGLHFDNDLIDLKEALKIARNKGKRSILGVELFEKLLKEGRLYAATKEGYKPLSRFNAGLFFDFWARLDFIKTQEEKVIKK
jgi:hypothetical protein